jgi:30S ribosomal protein S31
MGRGDKKTKKGKISMGSYGNSRPKEKNKATAAPVAEAPKKEKKEAKAPAKKK